MITVNYQLDAIFVYFSSTCFGLTRPSSGALEFIISLQMQHMAFLVQLGVGLEERARWWCFALTISCICKEIINYNAPENGRVSPKHVELK